MSMLERMETAEFNVITPQCNHCINRKNIDYDSEEYYENGCEILICKKGVKITKEIDQNISICHLYREDTSKIEYLNSFKTNKQS